MFFQNIMEMYTLKRKHGINNMPSLRSQNEAVVLRRIYNKSTFMCTTEWSHPIPSIGLRRQITAAYLGDHYVFIILIYSLKYLCFYYHIIKYCCGLLFIYIYIKFIDLLSNIFSISSCHVCFHIL